MTGFFYNPDLVLAAAKLKVAEAAIITAGERPNPILGVGPAYAATAAPNFAPWVLGGAEWNFPIETAGKRGYRIAEAERQADAAAFSLSEAAWRIRSSIRAALINYLLAQRQSELAQVYVVTSQQITDLLQQRVAAGAAANPALNLAMANLATARLKAAQARSRVPDTLNVLAAAVGVPVEAVRAITLAWPTFDQPWAEANLSAARVRRWALTNRIELRKALAQYAAADEALKLEIARQYPNINLGGGYSWEVNENIFELLPVATLPLMNHNQGPIAEAEARRRQVAAEFVALQDSIIAQARGALARYRGSLGALQEGSSSAAFAKRRLVATQLAADLGDIDALTLATTRLETIVAEQSRLAALADAQAALGTLEDAVGRPLRNDELRSFKLPPLETLLNG